MRYLYTKMHTDDIGKDSNNKLLYKNLLVLLALKY